MPLNEGIFSHRWEPDSESGAPLRTRGVYLLHGTGEHAGRYDELATKLTQAGWLVGAHDHPGHGRSSGDRGKLLPHGVLAVQAAIQIQQFAHETGAPPVVLGHSLGGLLAAELVLCHQFPVAGLVLSAPAFRPWISTLNRLKLAVMHGIAPDKVLELAYRPDLLTHDVQKLEASEKDSLIHGFKSARLVRWLFDTGAICLQRAPDLNVPTLVLVAGEDPVIDPSSIRDWIARAPEDLVDTHEYANSYHEIYNEIESIRLKAFDDTVNWLDHNF